MSKTTKISILAIDLAKGSLQVCAVGPDGAVVFNRAVSRICEAQNFPSSLGKLANLIFDAAYMGIAAAF